MSTRYPQPALDAESKTLRAGSTWRGRGRSSVAVRGFRFHVDQPARLGGLDEAPTPMELVLGAVDACLAVVAEQTAAERGLRLDDLQVYSLARQDLRGAAGTAEVQPYFHRYRLQIAVATPEADEGALAAFAAEVERRCPALNLVRDANVELAVAWTFAERLGPRSAEAACNAALGYDADLPAEDLGAEPRLVLEQVAR